MITPVALTSGDFAEPSRAPIRIGVTRAECPALNAERTRFAFAGHRCGGADAVDLDGVAVTGWISTDEAFGDGVIHVIEFGQAVESGTVFAIGRGLISDTTGALIESMDAAVIALCTLAGLPASVVFGAPAITIGGSIAEPVELATVLWDIADATYTAWRRDGSAIIFTASESAPARQWSANDGQYSQLERITRLRATYGAADQSDAVGAVEVAAAALEASGALLRADAHLPWLSDERAVVSVVSRMCAHRSRVRWAVDATLKPGERPSVGDALMTPYGTGAISGTAHGELVSVTADVVDGDSYAVAVVSRSVRQFGEGGAAQGGAEIVADVKEYQIQSSAGQPLAGAEVLVNGSGPLVTDAGGVVRVPRALLRSGLNDIVATSPGFAPVVMQVQA